MGEFKTIISANIPVSLAEKLKNKTKGTRSRVITRALTAYLADQEAFNIGDIDTRTLLIVLMNRDDCPKAIQTLIMEEVGRQRR